METLQILRINMYYIKLKCIRKKRPKLSLWGWAKFLWIETVFVKCYQQYGRRGMYYVKMQYIFKRKVWILHRMYFISYYKNAITLHLLEFDSTDKHLLLFFYTADFTRFVSYLYLLGVCHDCCLWFGIYHTHLVCWLLLSIPWMARKVAICKKTILCNRWDSTIPFLT